MEVKLITILIPLLVSFLTSVIVAPILIPWLHKLKFGQQILEDGPTWHKNKQGTPTMGGIIFILGITVFSIINLITAFDIHYFMLYIVSLGFGIIGFIDDYIKVVKKRNLGLTALQKLILQAALSTAYIYVLNRTGNLSTEIIIPFSKTTMNIPWILYIPFILFVVVGTVNSVNLTDGLDGLATSVTIAVSLFFACMAVIFGSNATAFFAISVIGGLIAFLIFNRHPAKVFMGDTGSLFLGGVISVMAVGLKMPLILVIAGFVYLFEALSVILQVASFKLTGKRIFKMSPVHHHFEMCGWKENKIVIVFTTVTVILCIIAFLAVKPCISI